MHGVNVLNIYRLSWYIWDLHLKSNLNLNLHEDNGWAFNLREMLFVSQSKTSESEHIFSAYNSHELIVSCSVSYSSNTLFVTWSISAVSKVFIWAFTHSWKLSLLPFSFPHTKAIYRHKAFEEYWLATFGRVSALLPIYIMKSLWV